MRMLDPGFFDWIRIPQSERGEAAVRLLKPLKYFMASKGVYVHVMRIPGNSSFWEEYPYELDTVDKSQPCLILYIGSTIRSFRIRVGNEYMSKEHRQRHPCLHYRAMDASGSDHEWYLLAEAREGESFDRADIRITEAVAISSCHTYTSVDFSAILKKYGIFESMSTARGVNRTSGMRDWGIKTMDSAIQMVLYQRLLEEYGSDGWTFAKLPPLISTWLSAQKEKKEIQGYLERAVETGTSLSEALNRIMGKLGAKVSRNIKLAKSVQKVLSGGTFRLRYSCWTRKDPGFFIFGLRAVPVRHPCAKIGEGISVHFIVSEGTHPLRFAKDALQEDPGRRLAILVSGRDAEGDEWRHWCRTGGDKTAMRANSYFDLITGTGSALTDCDIPRRCYYKEPNNLRYTDGAIGSTAKAIEELDLEKRMALQQDHEGSLILDTPPRSKSKEVEHDVETTSTVRKMIEDPTQTSKTLKRSAPPNAIAVASPRKAKKSKLAGLRPPQLPEPSEAQEFLEIDLQKILGNTDLYQCFENWVRKQRAAYKVMKTVTETSKNVALNFRFYLKSHQTCWEPLWRLNDQNLGMVYVRLCKMKERDDQEALLYA